MRKSILRMAVYVFIFLAGAGFGAFGLWLVDGNHPEQLFEKQPQAKVSDFVQAIVRKDGKLAARIWELELPAGSPTAAQGDLLKRREDVLSGLLAENISPDYMVLNIEWWHTCCSLSVTSESRNAGGARLTVQFINQSGQPLLYTFDVFARSQPYFGSAAGNPARDWVLRDVYQAGQQPLFWRMIYEPQIRFSDAPPP